MEGRSGRTLLEETPLAVEAQAGEKTVDQILDELRAVVSGDCRKLQYHTLLTGYYTKFYLKIKNGKDGKETRVSSLQITEFLDLLDELLSKKKQLKFSPDEINKIESNMKVILGRLRDEEQQRETNPVVKLIAGIHQKFSPWLRHLPKLS